MTNLTHSPKVVGPVTVRLQTTQRVFLRSTSLLHSKVSSLWWRRQLWRRKWRNFLFQFASANRCARVLTFVALRRFFASSKLRQRHITLV